MAPLCITLRKHSTFETVICTTGQHQEMLQQALEVFDLVADEKLQVMTTNQTLDTLSSKLLTSFSSVLNRIKPDLVLVHGDTTTSFICALASYYKKIAVGHVEAGLRTKNIYSPWPEEGNRCLTKVLTKLHFAPTMQAKQNLMAEGVDEHKITISGNTSLDALKFAINAIEHNKGLIQEIKKGLPQFAKKMILVTGHRRENYDQGFQNICQALKRIANINKDISIVYPVHLNPKVANTVYDNLSNLNNIHLIKPVNYLQFIYLMQQCTFILTDSGGIQEEAPSLQKPVLLMRESTERPEAVAKNLTKLVGNDIESICDSVQSLLDQPELLQTMTTKHNPYGDGFASKYIAETIATYYRS